jgi:hypothetical protein
VSLKRLKPRWKIQEEQREREQLRALWAEELSPSIHGEEGRVMVQRPDAGGAVIEAPPAVSNEG